MVKYVNPFAHSPSPLPPPFVKRRLMDTLLGGEIYIQMQNAQETCAFKTVLSGGAGFVLGGAFGLFMASVSLILSLYLFFPPSLSLIRSFSQFLPLLSSIHH